MSTTAIAIGSAAMSLAGNLIGSKLTSDARRAALGHIEAEYFRNPLETIAGKALLKKRAMDREEAIAGMNNRIAAGGATFENELAMRKALNRADSDFESSLLIDSEGRRRALADQRSQIIQNGYMQDAHNWSTWGAQMAQAGMQFGESQLLKDYGKKSLQEYMDSQPHVKV